MAQAGVKKPTLRGSKLKTGWWIVTLPDGSLHGFYSWHSAMASLCAWVRSQNSPVNG